MARPAPGATYKGASALTPAMPGALRVLVGPDYQAGAP
jgi:hypothetical protein